MRTASSGLMADEQGLTLLDLLVAAAIFAIGALAVGSVMILNNQSQFNESRKEDFDSLSSLIMLMLQSGTACQATFGGTTFVPGGASINQLTAGAAGTVAQVTTDHPNLQITRNNLEQASGT